MYLELDQDCDAVVCGRLRGVLRGMFVKTWRPVLAESRLVVIRISVLGEVGTDGILMDVPAADFEVICVTDAMVGKAALPDGYLRGEAAGKAAPS